MTHDARINVHLPDHPKLKKLKRIHGAAGAWYLVCLFLWVAANRPTGELTGMTDDDIELSIDWAGEAGAFVRALREVGFLDGESDGYRVHDWQEHNPWAAGSADRSEKARFASLCKTYGRAQAEIKMPEYAKRLAAQSDGEAHATGKLNPASSKLVAASSKPRAANSKLASTSGSLPLHSGTAPSPLPFPSPYPIGAAVPGAIRSPDDQILTAHNDFKLGICDEDERDRRIVAAGGTPPQRKIGANQR